MSQSEAQPRPPARYASGDRVDGRYQISALLGNGAAAEVYRAVEIDTGRDVVLKLPHVALAGDLAAYNRYQREMEITRELDHPALQRLRSDPRARYMVFDYVEGQTLRKYLVEHGRLPIDKALDITRQLTDALEYIHQHGIVHRDLKPENILIGPDGHITLTDFGIALRLASRRLTFSHLSNAVGTPDYMAPEQVRGERGDARTDVYALGCVLYELLIGEVPYPANEAHEAMQRKVNTEPPLLRRKRPDAPPALEAVVYRALRRRPDERYQSMAALAHDIANLESVAIPNYRPDVPPPSPLGDLPPCRTTLTILIVILLVFVAIGVLAQFAHHAS